LFSVHSRERVVKLVRTQHVKLASQLRYLETSLSLRAVEFTQFSLHHRTIYSLSTRCLLRSSGAHNYSP